MFFCFCGKERAVVSDGSLRLCSQNRRDTKMIAGTRPEGLRFAVEQKGRAVRLIASGKLWRVTFTHYHFLNVFDSVYEEQRRQDETLMLLREVFPCGVALMEQLEESRIPTTAVIKIPNSKHGPTPLQLTVAELRGFLDENLHLGDSKAGLRKAHSLESAFREALIRLIGGEQHN